MNRIFFYEIYAIPYSVGDIFLLHLNLVYKIQLHHLNFCNSKLLLSRYLMPLLV